MIFVYCDGVFIVYVYCFFFSSRRRHTRCALVTGVQTCALPIWVEVEVEPPNKRFCASVLLEDTTARVILLMRVSNNANAVLANTIIAHEIGRASCRERVCQYV